MQIVQQSAGNTTPAAQIKRGNMALEDREWQKADGFFEEALNMDPECAEAYLGKLLAKDQAVNFSAWLSGQKSKYRTVTEKRAACSENTVHINEMVSRYVVPGYLDEDAIRRQYADFLNYRCYESELPGSRTQKTAQLQALTDNRLLVRAEQYASDDMKKQIHNALADITAVLDQHIEQARKQDEAGAARAAAAYASYLDRTDTKVKALNAEALERREKRYLAAVDLMRNAHDIPGYRKAAEALKAMEDYKDSKALAEQCLKEIEWIKDEEQKRKYQAAAALMRSAKDVPGYEEAWHKLKLMEGYKDSETLAAQCRKVIEQRNDTKEKIIGWIMFLVITFLFVSCYRML